MQVKIIIGTVAFMLTMMVFGFAALREPARLEAFTLAREARQIESGAHIFEVNCTTCHGVDGLVAEGCTNPDTGESDCIGLPLNSQSLLCIPEGEDTTPRLSALSWGGDTESYIHSIVSVGRNAMPTWAQQYGGALRNDQIEDVSKYIANFESETLCSQPVITFDWPESADDYLVDFPDGDAANGEAVFASLGCTACHGNLDDEASAAVGPFLGDLANVGGTRVDGYSAEQYVYESVLDPSA
ncbi:MAG: c-type cytochrome [Methylococcales bacterium]|nr:c-type cytochrome [Methylococcales bacterium]